MLRRPGLHKELVSRRYSKSVFPAETYNPGRTCIFAGTAEDASASVNDRPLGIKGHVDGMHWAGRNAEIAAVPAGSMVYHRPPDKPWGQLRRRPIRIGHGPIFLLDAGFDNP